MENLQKMESLEPFPEDWNLRSALKASKALRDYCLAPYDPAISLETIDKEITRLLNDLRDALSYL